MWIDLDSEDELLRRDSEICLKQEIAWASHLSLQVFTILMILVYLILRHTNPFSLYDVKRLPKSLVGVFEGDIIIVSLQTHMQYVIHCMVFLEYKSALRSY